MRELGILLLVPVWFVSLVVAWVTTAAGLLFVDLRGILIGAAAFLVWFYADKALIRLGFNISERLPS